MSIEIFEAERPRLLGLAYRMLGSVADAEDAVQDTWLRWQASPQSELSNPAAWLTAVTTRLALDRLRTARRRREGYVGPWLPEPVADELPPDERAELAESLTLGFLAVLENLGPVERVVFLLADVFSEPFPFIAGVVGKSEAACRQIASRARRRVRAERGGARAADRRLLERLVLALSAGSIESMLDLLAPGVVLVSDGGIHRRAARRQVVGPERVARFLVNVSRRWPRPLRVETINSAPAIIAGPTRALVVLSAEADGQSVTTIHLLVSPEKLGLLERRVSIR